MPELEDFSASFIGILYIFVLALGFSSVVLVFSTGLLISILLNLATSSPI